jgi:hypothetical protein
MRNHTYWAALPVLAVSVCILAGSAVAHPLAAPTIRNFTPKQGPLNSQLTVVGSNLAGAQVTVAGSQATNVVVNKYGDSLTAIVPNVPDAMPVGAKVQIVVTTASGTATAPGTFMVTAVGPGHAVGKPHITGISPMKGKAGTKVTISGQNLGGAQWVKLDGMKTVYKVPSQTKIVATVPKQGHSGRITLKTDGGTVISARFTVLAG